MEVDCGQSAGAGHVHGGANVPQIRRWRMRAGERTPTSTSRDCWAPPQSHSRGQGLDPPGLHQETERSRSDARPFLFSARVPTVPPSSRGPRLSATGRAATTSALVLGPRPRSNGSPRARARDHGSNRRGSESSSGSICRAHHGRSDRPQASRSAIRCLLELVDEELLGVTMFAPPFVLRFKPALSLSEQVGLHDAPCTA